MSEPSWIDSRMGWVMLDSYQKREKDNPSGANPLEERNRGNEGNEIHA